MALKYRALHFDERWRAKSGFPNVGRNVYRTVRSLLNLDSRRVDGVFSGEKNVCF